MIFIKCNNLVIQIRYKKNKDRMTKTVSNLEEKRKDKQGKKQ